MSSKRQDQGIIIVLITALWLLVGGIVVTFFVWPVGVTMLLIDALLMYAAYLLTSQ